MDETILLLIGTVAGIVITLCYNRYVTGSWKISKEQIEEVQELVKEIINFFTRSEPITATKIDVIAELPQASYTMEDEYRALVLSTCSSLEEEAAIKEDIRNAEVYSADPAEYTLRTSGKYGGKWRVDVGRPVLIESNFSTYKYLSQTKIAEICMFDSDNTYQIMSTIITYERELAKEYTMKCGEYLVTVCDGEYTADKMEST